MSIFKIVYRSHAVWHADQAKNELDIENIISEARAWNSAHGITGALLVSSYGYAQVLEGPSWEVKPLFGRISLDSRHRNVELLYNEVQAERDFENWAMALVGPSDQADIELGSTSYQFDVAIPDNSEEVRKMLRWLLIDEPATRIRSIH